MSYIQNFTLKFAYFCSSVKKYFNGALQPRSLSHHKRNPDLEKNKEILIIIG